MSGQELTGRLRQDLTAAMRAREQQTVRVLRTVLAAIANAEAQPDQEETPVSLRSQGTIAGASRGLGTSDVPRRVLDADDVRAIVAAERDERLASADDLAGRGAQDAADSLRAEAVLLGRYLA